MAVQFQRLKSSSEGVKQLRELNQLYAEAFNDQEVYSGNKPSDKYLLRNLAKDSMFICTASFEGKVVAGLTAYVIEKMEQENCEIYIYDLAVDKNFRRQKIAARLLKYLIAEGKNIGAAAVFIQADREDAPAVALYESFGDREEVYHFDIYLKK
ncbi:GNAT family N-acetyltransferase [Alkalicoccus daliensis]|uniref:Aminoglycoside 3-N-acetyltransferase I n=1 Tax=Alkalicoccus daliensis TaxID=745820 RepID=A0A1H0EQK5_9BACI|nr:GNAT family N-acetyltransferase [Alkalicoccus daliensis]SDN84652.1 aminoglycoside 3-N-acetyltransferase I [Alkalicoccus daliensis]